MQNKHFRNQINAKSAEQTERVLPGEPPVCRHMTSEPSAEMPSIWFHYIVSNTDTTSPSNTTEEENMQFRF